MNQMHPDTHHCQRCGGTGIQAFTWRGPGPLDWRPERCTECDDTAAPDTATITKTFKDQA